MAAGALGPDAIWSVAGGAAMGAVAGYAKGNEMAVNVADAVKFAGGAHRMTCKVCNQLYQTPKKHDDGAHGRCAACRDPRVHVKRSNGSWTLGLVQEYCTDGSVVVVVVIKD